MYVSAAGLLFLCYHILTFRRWGDEYPYVMRFLLCFSAMVVELLWENVMVWWVLVLPTQWGQSLGSNLDC